MLRVEAEARKGGHMSFINVSNHMSSKWSEAQLNAALSYGNIVDVQFPSVSPSATHEDIIELAEKLTNDVYDLAPDIVMIQGEMTLVFAVVTMLKSKGIRCVAACSRRRSDEEVQKLAASGLTKEGMFEFMGFREY